jgi:hypothetical protein
MEHKLVIEYNGDFRWKDFLQHLHKLGNDGCSRGVVAMDGDDKPVKFGWDGDGADRICSAEIDGMDILPPKAEACSMNVLRLEKAGKTFKKRTHTKPINNQQPTPGISAPAPAKDPVTKSTHELLNKHSSLTGTTPAASGAHHTFSIDLPSDWHSAQNAKIHEGLTKLGYKHSPGRGRELYEHPTGHRVSTEFKGSKFVAEHYAPRPSLEKASMNVLRITHMLQMEKAAADGFAALNTLERKAYVLANPATAFLDHIKPGALHKEMHIPEGEHITDAELDKEEKHAGPVEQKRIQFARNARKRHHG